MKTTPTSPAEHLAQPGFALQDVATLHGRPVGVTLSGDWRRDGTCDADLTMTALEPLDHCRIIAGLRFDPAAPEPLWFARVSDPADPRDDDGVLERHFERPLVEILTAICEPLHGAFVAAAKIRAEGAVVAEMPDRFTAGELLRFKWVH